MTDNNNSARLLEADFPNSSSLSKVNYNRPLSVLTVTFRNGSSYHYFAVPADLVEQLIATKDAGDSAGKFLHRNIRGKFQFEKSVI